MRRTAALHGFAAAPERTWQRRLVAIVGGLALALTGLIAWQIRLAAQVEKAEGLRGLERARLGLERVAEEVQDELDRLRSTFGGAYSDSDTLGIGLAVRRGKWRAGAIRPELLTAVCVVRDMNEARPRCLDAEGYLRPGPWPTSLRLWAGRNPGQSSRAAAPVLVISKMPFGLEPPDRSRAPELRRFNRPQERILLGLNRTLLTDTLPRLLLWRHLDVDTQSRVTVYVRPA
ncbi:MAG TPA: hypothetical protein VD948_06560, partial [Rhodothermales bacterium]|nr:hypothetical protein [Rhodothermales bacterium]